MSRPLVCDNPTCETVVSAEELDELLLAVPEEKLPARALPQGWVSVSEIDEESDDVLLGECCSRRCAASLLTMEVAD